MAKHFYAYLPAILKAFFHEDTEQDFAQSEMDYDDLMDSVCIGVDAGELLVFAEEVDRFLLANESVSDAQLLNEVFAMGALSFPYGDVRRGLKEMARIARERAAQP